MDYGAYASLSDIRTALAYTASDTADDTQLLAKVEAVSRWIDNECQRHFYVKVDTRYFTAEHSDRLLLPYDLLSVTSLKTDEDDDYDYDYTWTATDYHLLPFNDWPKWEIKTKANGNYSFPSNERGVEIAGQWGHGRGDGATAYEDSTTTTNEELDASETGVDVASGTPLSAGQTILVESEQMYIRSISTNTLTVWRGVNGTTAATHATAKTVYVYRYPDAVREAAIIQTARLMKRKDAPFGVTGSAEMGTTFIARLDPDVKMLLNPYRRLTVG